MSRQTTTSFTNIPSPVGPLTLIGEGDDLTGVYFETGSSVAAPRDGWVRDDRRLQPAADQLAEYFAGKRVRFDLSLAPRGTAFQKAVWAALLQIPERDQLAALLIPQNETHGVQALTNG